MTTAVITASANSVLPDAVELAAAAAPGRRRRLILALRLAILVVFLGVEWPEAALGALFLAYALSGPAVTLARAVSGRPRWAVDEDDDEDDDTSVLVAEAEDARDGAS